MCLAIPLKVIHIENGYGIVEAEGVRRKVSIQLLEDVCVGDYIIVHAGYGLHRIDEKTAAETLSLLREAVAAVEGSNPEPRFSVTEPKDNPAC